MARRGGHPGGRGSGSLLPAVLGATAALLLGIRTPAFVPVDSRIGPQASPVLAGRRGAARGPALGRPSPAGLRLRASAAPSAVQEESKEAQPWTQKKIFQDILGCILVANTIVLGMQYRGWIGAAMITRIDELFAAVFAVELALHLLVEGPRYFKTIGHWVDTALVTAMLLDCFILTSPHPLLEIASRVYRLERLFKYVEEAPLELVRWAGVGFFVAVNYELRMRGVQSIIGLMGMFGGLVFLQRFAKWHAQRAYRGLEPAKTFLVKWATLFFVPALVKLPLVREHFQGTVLPKLAVLLVAGFLCTFSVSAVVANLFPEEKLEEEAPSGAKPAPVPWALQRDRTLLPIYGAAMVVCMLGYRVGFKPAAMQTVYLVCATIAGFIAGMLSPAKIKSFPLFHPLFQCIAYTWLAALLWGAQAGMSFLSVIEAYSTGAGTLINFMLGPAVVCLGVLLFERRKLLAQELVPMLGVTSISAGASLFITALLAKAVGLPDSMAVASLVRCITSAIAIDLCSPIGANPTFAVAMVVVTGFLGVILGPTLFKLLPGMKSPRTRGLAMGCSAHGLGTVALAEGDKEAFPYGAVAFVLMGMFTAVYLQVSPVRTALLSILR